MATPRKTRTARTPKPTGAPAGPVTAATGAAELFAEPVVRPAVPEGTGTVAHAVCAANVCTEEPLPGGAFCAPHVAAGWRKVEA